MNEPQPAPDRNELPGVWGLVVDDMRERDQVGTAKYGTPLQPFNGRIALVDAYQETLDQAVYLRQAIEELRRCRDCRCELSSEAGPLCLPCMIERVRQAGFEVTAR